MGRLLQSALRAAGPLITFVALTGCGGNKNMTPADEMGAAFDDFNAEIREVVTEPERADQVVALVDKLEKELRLMQNQINAREADFRKLNANYDTSEQQFKDFAERVERETRENKETASTTYRALYKLLTPEERDALVKSRSKAVTAAVRNLEAA